MKNLLVRKIIEIVYIIPPYTLAREILSTNTQLAYDITPVFIKYNQVNFFATDAFKLSKE